MEALTGYQQVTAALEYHVEQILHAQPVASSLPPGVSYATTPVEPVQSHALQPPQKGSLAAMSELVIPQSEPWEPMSEFSDEPISLYAKSELDVCYANDPFTSTEVDSRLPTEDTLESFFAQLYVTEYDQFISQVPVVNDQVNIDLIRTHCQEEYGCFHNGPHPLDYPIGNDWNYSLFPETVIETSDASVHWLGEIVDLAPPEDTVQGCPVEEPFKCEVFDVHLSMQVDANGNCVPMATAYVLVKSIQGVPCSRLFKCLFDTGGTRSMAHRKVLPAG